MSYIVQLGNLKVICETAADVVRLHEELARQKGASRTAQGNGAARPRPDRQQARHEESTRKITRLLEVIQSHSPRGISSEKLTKALGLGGARGIGGLTGALDRRVTALGIDRNDVIYVEKSEAGEKIWRAGSRIAEAIEGLKESNP